MSRLRLHIRNAMEEKDSIPPPHKETARGRIEETTYTFG
jgi:hypothetical protein